MTIQGSTNVLAGGTVLVRGNKATGRGFDVKASHVNLYDLAIREAGQGIRLENNSYITMQHILSYSNQVGIYVTNAHTVALRNMRLWDTASKF